MPSLTPQASVNPTSQPLNFNPGLEVIILNQGSSRFKPTAAGRSARDENECYKFTMAPASGFGQQARRFYDHGPSVGGSSIVKHMSCNNVPIPSRISEWFWQQKISKDNSLLDPFSRKFDLHGQERT